MSVEFVCPGCERPLRVSVDPSSQRARCPICNTLFDVPGGSTPATAGDQDPTSRRWHVRIPEGLTYGPVSQEELDRWVAEGRVNAECELRADGQTTWSGAAAVYSVFPTRAEACAESPPRAAPRRAPNAGFPPAAMRTLAPHRGAIILALGILSWASCPVFGLFAWILGNADLNQMRAGRMDNDGLVLTQAGRLLGMIHVLLTMVVVGLIISVALVLAVSAR